MSFLNEEIDVRGFNKQQELVAQLDVARPVVFDIGGNIGQSIDQYLTLFPEAIIRSFEPNPDAYAVLSQKYADAGQVTCFPLAMGKKSGPVDFYAADLSEVSSTLETEPFVADRSAADNYKCQKMSVDMTTLTEFCATENIEHINILKIDVQGAELAALQGAASLLQDSHIDLLYIEVLFAENYVNQCYFDEVWAYLKQFNYVLWDLFPFLHTRAGRVWTGNAIFVSSPIKKILDP